MNILYYSVHQILEDDEIRLFKRLGHNVFCLGVNSAAGALQGFRDPIPFSPAEVDFYTDFAKLGGYFKYGEIKSLVIPDAFIARFDLVVVMHDTHFIRRFWQSIKSKIVVWRTIGQGVADYEVLLKPFREEGLRIIRYSSLEAEIPNSLGEEAVIRFGKSPSLYHDWHGQIDRVLTFSNFYSTRYPSDFSDYNDIVRELHSALGGVGNEDAPNSIGMVDFCTQMRLMRESRCYLYASGLYIPYTLNFIEAWMTGIPVIVYVPPERQGKYFEIDKLIDHGKTGFICRSKREARETILGLVNNIELCRIIGSAGRQAAISIFSEEKASDQWANFFSTCERQISVPDLPSSIQGSPTTMKNVSTKVFDTLSMLRPYDIDIEKVRYGNARDGGYVLADLPPVADVLSFGVGPDVTFEYAMAERGRLVFLHDHTVDDTPQAHRRFSFSKMGICGPNNTKPDLEVLEYHLGRIDTKSEFLILKMDVEGAEWDVFSEIPTETLERFEQIVLEIHWLENLGNEEFRNKVAKSLSNLNRLFTLFHVHANNCAELHIIDGFTVASVLELSFVKTSLVRRAPSTKVYPSSLDKANHPLYHDLPLLFFPFIPSSVAPEAFKNVVHRLEMERSIATE